MVRIGILKRIDLSQMESILSIVFETVLGRKKKASFLEDLDFEQS